MDRGVADLNGELAAVPQDEFACEMLDSYILDQADREADREMWVEDNPEFAAEVVEWVDADPAAVTEEERRFAETARAILPTLTAAPVATLRVPRGRARRRRVRRVTRARGAGASRDGPRRSGDDEDDEADHLVRLPGVAA